MSYSSVYTTAPLPIVPLISGPIVTCLTSSSIRMTTSPVRCSMPKIGGFSFANVPRPRSPFNRRRRGGRSFFDRLGMALMSRHHIDFVAFHLATERDLRLALHDALAQLRCHDLGIVRIQIEFLSDLLIREIQSHEVEAEDPGPQRLMMTGEDGTGQVVILCLAGLSPVPLSR